MLLQIMCHQGPYIDQAVATSRQVLLHHNGSNDRKSRPCLVQNTIMSPTWRHAAVKQPWYGQIECTGSLRHIRVAPIYWRPLPSPRASDGPSHPAAPHHSRSDIFTAKVLVRARLHRFAAVRHGNGRRHVPRGHVSARRGSGALERCVCTALASADGRALWREPLSPAALLSISILHQALARRFSRDVPRLSSLLGLRSVD